MYVQCMCAFLAVFDVGLQFFSLQSILSTWSLHTYAHTTAVVLSDVLPSCKYHPSYVLVHEVTRYTGFKEVLATVSYPDDHTWYKNGRHESEGNPIIEEEVSWDGIVVVCAYFRPGSLRWYKVAQ